MGKKCLLVLLGKLRVRILGDEVEEKFVEVYRVPEETFVFVYSNGDLVRITRIDEHTIITHQGVVIKLSEPRKLLELIKKHLKVRK